MLLFDFDFDFDSISYEEWKVVGEDRWLSTLLLKQGYRIEYAAAADAETYAPEGFDEFFNQRRRWTPSSVANTLDLLSDFKVEWIASAQFLFLPLEIVSNVGML